MAADLVDCVHEATLSAFNDWENGEDRLWQLVAALDRLFPGSQPVPYSADAEQAIDQDLKRRRDLRLALKKWSTRPK